MFTMYLSNENEESVYKVAANEDMIRTAFLLQTLGYLDADIGVEDNGEFFSAQEWLAIADA